MSILRSRYRYRDTGLLLLRLGVGIAFILHGWPKLAGGPESWAQIGQSMQFLGIGFAPVFWGFMAGFAEAVGGLMLLLGLFFRPFCVLLLCTMLIAITSHISRGDDFGGYSHALEAAVLFCSLLLIGPGKYSLDAVIFPKKKDRSTFIV
ncbi:DoxX family protein [Pontibacter sp. 172403-2]|uniref:DoxX family protein n=1 Tax=Pontibacter rufus TaxID=2791028 RepID=UPI0018AF8FC5|nr:DoxX family protein [Pontibacter sp. 172403-2]MBF9254095.1 DoxX family protein [Pontibacter sp. 172403-2]